MSKHTEGNWEILEDNLGCKNIVANIHGVRYGVATTDGMADEEEDLANARLIAAAPSLYKAAKLTLKMLEDMTTEDFSQGADKPFRDALEAAIRKAKGTP